MARYIDMDKLSEMIKARAEQLIEGKEAMLYVAKWLNLLPEADVAPRAEVEKIFDELMQEASVLVDRYHRLADDANDHIRIRHRGVECGASLVLLKISELKKKYTEVQK